MLFKIIIFFRIIKNGHILESICSKRQNKSRNINFYKLYLVLIKKKLKLIENKTFEKSFNTKPFFLVLFFLLVCKLFDF